ncbi:hypothetical protein MMPV_001182 [Pyropia vietnamensis]
MGKLLKKGTRGNAIRFITRSKALSKLQISLRNFRRLCILKGIFPREPKKKVEGPSKTYYLRKDISFLAHEPLLATFRASSAHKKKIRRALAKKQTDVVRALKARRPRYTLEHIVRERYPTFESAIRDLDDALSLIALFASLPARPPIRPTVVGTASRLLAEFTHYVSRMGGLRKTFASVKGFYFQATVAGELVTWCVPHRFSQELPTDVDYRVMLTFMELYTAVLHVVNFKLYSQAGWAYPPTVDRSVAASGRLLAAFKTRPPVFAAADGPAAPAAPAPAISKDAIAAAQNRLADAMVTTAAAEEDDEEVGPDIDEALGLVSAGGDARAPGGGAAGAPVGAATSDAVTPVDDDGDVPTGMAVEAGDGAPPGATVVVPDKIFAGTVVILGRETPVPELEFVLLSCGAAKVVAEDDIPADDEPVGPQTKNGGATEAAAAAAAAAAAPLSRQALLASVTHWVADRPTIRDRLLRVEYVQPQWVLDSVNAGLLLPPALYAVGAQLPPHLSPFVDAASEGGYKPRYQVVLDRIRAGDESVVAEAAAAFCGPTGGKRRSASRLGPAGHRHDEVVAALDAAVAVPSPAAPLAGVGADGPSPGEVDTANVDDAVDGAKAEGEEDTEEEDVEEDEKLVAFRASREEAKAHKLALSMMSKKKRAAYMRATAAERKAALKGKKLLAKRKRLEAAAAAAPVEPYGRSDDKDGAAADAAVSMPSPSLSPAGAGADGSSADKVDAEDVDDAVDGAEAKGEEDAEKEDVENDMENDTEDVKEDVKEDEKVVATHAPRKAKAHKIALGTMSMKERAAHVRATAAERKAAAKGSKVLAKRKRLEAAAAVSMPSPSLSPAGAGADGSSADKVDAEDVDDAVDGAEAKGEEDAEKEDVENDMENDTEDVKEDVKEDEKVVATRAPRKAKAHKIALGTMSMKERAAHVRATAAERKAATKGSKVLAKRKRLEAAAAVNMPSPSLSPAGAGADGSSADKVDAEDVDDAVDGAEAKGEEDAEKEDVENDMENDTEDVKEDVKEDEKVVATRAPRKAKAHKIALGTMSMKERAAHVRATAAERKAAAKGSKVLAKRKRLEAAAAVSMPSPSLSPAGAGADGSSADKVDAEDVDDAVDGAEAKGEEDAEKEDVENDMENDTEDVKEDVKEDEKVVATHAPRKAKAHKIALGTMSMKERAAHVRATAAERKAAAKGSKVLAKRKRLEAMVASAPPGAAAPGRKAKRGKRLVAVA